MADPDHVLSSDVDTNCSTGRAVWYTRFRDRPTSACNCGHTVFLPGRTSQSCYRRRPGRTQYNNDHWRSRKIFLQIALVLHAYCCYQISTLGDPRIFRGSNHARDRRILFVIAYLAGCFAGSALNAYDTTCTFFLAFGMKMFICATFLFTPGMVADLEKQDDEGTRTPVSHILWGD
jgi:hypothetical protein